MKIEAIAHASVTGKVLHYLRVSNGSLQHLMNVSEATYDKIKEMEAQMGLPLEDKPKGKKDELDKNK